jgi:hypothetical protein
MSLSDTISGSAVVVAVPDQISSDLNGEVVILNFQSGVYFGLNPVGARIWQIIQQPRTLDEIQAILLEEYEVEAEVCWQELQVLLQQLIHQGLVEVKYGATA